MAREDTSAGTVGEIITNIRNDVKSVVQSEIALAKTELIPSAKKAGVGAGLFAGAAAFALGALLLLLVAAALGVAALGVPIALAFLLVGVALLILAAILGAVGFSFVKKVKAPEQTITEAKATAVALKGAVARGKAAATAPQIEGRVAD